MSFQTADLCDQHEALLRDGSLRVAAPLFRTYGGRRSFHGPVATLKLFEDNSLVRAALESAGGGRVLVVDGGGSLRCALVGDQLARLGVKNGWAGILVHGCIRDSRTIGEMDIGLLALATHPQKSVKKGLGETDVPVSFAGLRFLPGEHLYADDDGVIVCATALL
jgi:regulator of ribonuclease activity A